MFGLSSIFKTSFLGLMTGCGKNKKIKSRRSHDRCSGLPRGLAVPAQSSLLPECSDKAGLRVNTTLPVTPFHKVIPLRTIWQLDNHSSLGGLRGQSHS